MAYLNVASKAPLKKKFSLTQVTTESFSSMMPHVVLEVALIGEATITYSTLERVDFSVDDIDVPLEMPATAELSATGCAAGFDSGTVTTECIHCPLTFCHLKLDA